MGCIIGLIELRIAFVGLVCLGSGIALCLYTLALWREARPESPALAALEVMSDDAYIDGDERVRRDLIQMARDIASGSTRAPQGRVGRAPVRPQRSSVPRSRVVEEFSEEPRRGPIDPLLK
jgi:hypothetical protein